MKRIIILPLLFAAGLLCACGAGKAAGTAPAADTSPADAAGGYTAISAEEAKRIMDGEDAFILLDVRTAEEYAEGHIPGAVLLPDCESEDAAELLPDKNALILVYCRSGRRSKIAAEALAAKGYTQVKDFGGIINWPYEIVTE